MKPRVTIFAAILAAFLLGAMFDGYVRPALSNPLAQPPETAHYASPSPGAQNTVQRRAAYSEAPVVTHHRPWERQAFIIAGSPGAGAGIGAVAAGKRGAAIGALSGGVAGLVYDLATRNR